MKFNFGEEMLIKDKANTVPGIAYPMPARFVINCRKSFDSFYKQEKESKKK